MSQQHWPALSCWGAVQGPHSQGARRRFRGSQVAHCICRRLAAIALPPDRLQHCHAPTCQQRCLEASVSSSYSLFGSKSESEWAPLRMDSHFRRMKAAARLKYALCLACSPLCSLSELCLGLDGSSIALQAASSHQGRSKPDSSGQQGSCMLPQLVSCASYSTTCSGHPGHLSRGT